MEIVWGIAWFGPIIALCISVPIYVHMLERDMKIAEKRWKREHGE